MALAEVRQRPVHIAHRIVVAQMEQMKLRSVVVRVTKTRWPLGNSATGHHARWLFGCAFACSAALHPIWPKRDLDRGAFCAPAQPGREASLFPAEKSDPFCGA